MVHGERGQHDRPRSCARLFDPASIGEAATKSLPVHREQALESDNELAITQVELPDGLLDLGNPQRDLPRIARDPAMTDAIARALNAAATTQRLAVDDAATAMAALPAESVHLVVTSPPYWNLKEYPERDGQLGWINDYERFLDRLAPVWQACHRALVPGGRLVVVVGDVCLSRRRNGGRHTVVPLHASIIEQCRHIGYDNLSPIIWHKIANARHEASNSNGSFLGKPYEPNAVLKNDIEYVLMQRKPGGYRSVPVEARVLSLIPKDLHHEWFRQIWHSLPGASTRDHPAPFPEELAVRLVRMFSFAGDTVCDPFVGSGTTLAAAARWGRCGIGIDIEPSYIEQARQRLAGIPFARLLE